MKKFILISLVLLSLLTATEACMSTATNPSIQVTFGNSNAERDLIEKDGYSIALSDRHDHNTDTSMSTIRLRLDCGIGNDEIVYYRPENWEQQCTTSPEQFDWSGVFETETKALIDSGKLTGVSYEDVEEASELIIGYDLQIKNLDSPTGKLCLKRGWQITNGKDIYLENGCYKIRDATEMKTGCGELVPHFFELKGSHSVEEPEMMQQSRASFWQKLIIFFNQLV
jgi:hypothetical protein